MTVTPCARKRRRRDAEGDGVISRAQLGTDSVEHVIEAGLLQLRRRRGAEGAFFPAVIEAALGHAESDWFCL